MFKTEIYFLLILTWRVHESTKENIGFKWLILFYINKTTDMMRRNFYFFWTFCNNSLAPSDDCFFKIIECGLIFFISLLALVSLLLSISFRRKKHPRLVGNHSFTCKIMKTLIKNIYFLCFMYLHTTWTKFNNIRYHRPDSLATTLC